VSISRANSALFTLNRNSFDILKYIHANPGCVFNNCCSYFPDFWTRSKRDKGFSETKGLLSSMELEGYIVVAKDLVSLNGSWGPCWLTQSGQDVIDRVNWSSLAGQYGRTAQQVVDGTLKLAETTVDMMNDALFQAAGDKRRRR